MAKVQRRRTISFARPVYDALMAAALKKRVTASRFVVDALRKAGLDLPATEHQTFAVAAKAQAGKALKRSRAMNGWVGVGRG